MIMCIYGNATLDKGQNVYNDSNSAVDVIQEAIKQDKKIVHRSGTAHMLSGPTGYVHSLQELF